MADTLSELSAAVALAPTFFKAWARLASKLTELGRAEPAIEAWRRTLELAPEHAEAHAMLFGLLVGQGRGAEADVHIRGPLDPSSSAVKTWIRTARDLEGVGRQVEALQVWRALAQAGHFPPELHAGVQAAPTSFKAWARLASKLTELGCPEPAIEAWRRTLELAPDFAEAHAMLFGLLVGQGRCEEADVHIHGPLDPDPSSSAVKAWMRTARDLEGAGHKLEALLVWRRLAQAGHLPPGLRAAVDARPTSFKAWSRLASELMELGCAEPAIEAWRRTLELAPDYAEARAVLFGLLVGQGRGEEADALIRGPLAPSSNALKAWVRTARDLEDAGQEAAALQVWRRLAEVGSDAQPSELEVARLLFKRGDAEVALQRLRGLPDLTPSQFQPQTRIAQSLERRGNVPAAIRAWTNALAAIARTELTDRLPGAENDAPIAFIHLPRTGGNSLAEAVRAVHGPRAFTVKTRSAISDSDLALMPANLAFLRGHMNYGVHRDFPVRYSTVLREPIARCISHFELYRVQRAVQGWRSSFEEFITREWANNLQCQMLAGVLPTTGRSRRLLETARKHLCDFFAVGFSDDLDDFARRLGLPTPLRRVNSYHSGWRPSETELKELRRRNWADLQLYAWARSSKRLAAARSECIHGA